MVCLWIRTLICKALLWVVLDVGRSFSEKVRRWGEVMWPTMAWNWSTFKLVGTWVSIKALSRTSLWRGDVRSNLRIEICAGVFLRWSKRLYLWVDGGLVGADVEGWSLVEALRMKTWPQWVVTAQFGVLVLC